MNSIELAKQIGVEYAWNEPETDDPKSDHGWLGPANRRQLKKILDEVDPMIVIELGSWLGKSARFFVENSRAVVICIDTWKGSRVHQRKKFRDQHLKTLWKSFLSTNRKYKDRILPIKMSTLEASTLDLPKADLIYVDACHYTLDVYGDLCSYYRFLSDGGVICGDDYIQRSRRRRFHVKKAVDHFAKKYSFDVLVDRGFWKFERKMEDGQ